MFFFCQAHFMPFILKTKRNDVNQNKIEDKILGFSERVRTLQFLFAATKGRNITACMNGQVLV